MIKTKPKFAICVVQKKNPSIKLKEIYETEEKYGLHIDNKYERIIRVKIEEVCPTS